MEQASGAGGQARRARPFVGVQCSLYYKGRDAFLQRRRLEGRVDPARGLDGAERLALAHVVVAEEELAREGAAWSGSLWRTGLQPLAHGVIL